MATLPTSASFRLRVVLVGACLLTSGCLPSVHGPTADQGLQDVVFTADDIATVRQVSRSASGVPFPATSGTQSALVPRPPATVLPAPDPALIARYDAVRKVGSQTEAGVWEVANGFANVRSEPRSTATLVARLDQGVTLRLLSVVDGQWAKVQLADKRTGYVAHRYLARRTTPSALAEERKAFANTYYVNYAYVNVRAEPRQASDKLGQIPRATLIKPLAIQGEWATITFQGKPGYVALSYLHALELQFVVQNNQFHMPILRFSARDEAGIQRLRTGVQVVQRTGRHILSLREIANALLTHRELPAGVVVIVDGIRPETVKLVSEALISNGARATLALWPADLGIAGITQKTLSTLKANGFDLQSAGQTERDLRSLTPTDVQQELAGSRLLLEQKLGLPVQAIIYPQAKTNERVAEEARRAGYFLGVGDAQQPTFSRADLLTLPSYAVKADTDDETIRRMVR